MSNMFDTKTSFSTTVPEDSRGEIARKYLHSGKGLKIAILVLLSLFLRDDENCIISLALA